MSRIKVLFVPAFVIVVGALLSACSNTPAAAGPSSGSATAAETVAFVNADGKLACPVRGDVIASKDKADGYSDYKGKRYYFCCASCKPQFDADPEKYAKPK